MLSEGSRKLSLHCQEDARRDEESSKGLSGSIANRESSKVIVRASGSIHAEAKVWG
jgi:hypothetical protein